MLGPPLGTDLCPPSPRHCSKDPQGQGHSPGKGQDHNQGHGRNHKAIEVGQKAGHLGTAPHHP